jgi:hypothetical protein
MLCVRQRGFVVLAVVMVAAIGFVGWRSVFVGGWHYSGDGSYACPHSPWHTVLHPLPPDAFGAGVIAPGLPDLCNRDAKRVTFGWAFGMIVTVGAATSFMWFARRRHQPTT